MDAALLRPLTRESFSATFGRMPSSPLREYLYLDVDRLASIADQLDLEPDAPDDLDSRLASQRLFAAVEGAITGREPLRIDGGYDFDKWTPEAFVDGKFVVATGVVRLIDFDWLATALTGLPPVLRKMSKIEMEGLKNSEEGKRMSKQQLQNRQHENSAAISKVEEFKMEELKEVVRQVYGDVVRVKVRPSAQHAAAVLVGSAAPDFFVDGPATIAQRHGIEIDANWTVVGQLNVPNLTAQPQPMPTGNKMEDTFEQLALLMNGAFKVANSPAFPAVSFTPLAIYRSIG